MKTQAILALLLGMPSIILGAPLNDVNAGKIATREPIERLSSSPFTYATMKRAPDEDRGSGGSKRAPDEDRGSGGSKRAPDEDRGSGGSKRSPDEDRGSGNA